MQTNHQHNRSLYVKEPHSVIVTLEINPIEFYFYATSKYHKYKKSLELYAEFTISGLYIWKFFPYSGSLNIKNGW